MKYFQPLVFLGVLAIVLVPARTSAASLSIDQFRNVNTWYCAVSDILDLPASKLLGYSNTYDECEIFRDEYISANASKYNIDPSVYGVQEFCGVAAGHYVCLVQHNWYSVFEFFAKAEGKIEYKVLITKIDGSTEDTANIVSVEPGAMSDRLVAQVYDIYGNLVPDTNIVLTVEALDGSGGHEHSENESSGPRPLGYFYPGATPEQLSGNTGASGLEFMFKAPGISGDYRLSASCEDRPCFLEGPKNLWVGIKNLQVIPNYPSYQRLVPNRDKFHPENHYLSPSAVIVLQQLAFTYRSLFGYMVPSLVLNDASLERGGYFDLNRTWNTGNHFEHRKGTVVDVRANGASDAIPSHAFSEFISIARLLGVDAGLHCSIDVATNQCRLSTRHMHVRLMGRRE